MTHGGRQVTACERGGKLERSRLVALLACSVSAVQASGCVSKDHGSMQGTVIALNVFLNTSPYCLFGKRLEEAALVDLRSLSETRGSNKRRRNDIEARKAEV